ncbi:YtnP family quorum-quenching lactonase [Mesobacillus harenae]|uniref:YtnP family quorum-quenching lactonase n=1 Tax=Mesobacillus harenae TaxID=2213203 RepID=UPI00158023EF|nr:MBL fold metallo-hydrolase [Mesobacillus harenae]
METLVLENVKMTWLNGGVTHLDGGAMFGVVPKPLWSRKYPVNEQNQIELRTDPILLQSGGKNFLIETGIGKGKMNDKLKRNFGVLEESKLDESLEKLNLRAEDIDFILMTHLHFDHACGLTNPVGEGYVSAFPNARIITSNVEWNEMKNPNIRSKNTYWKENWEPIESQVEPFENEWNFGPIKMVHTGGHSNGHSIIVIDGGEDQIIHMADLMGTHAHQNPLWVMAYDDYPMDSIAAKQKWTEHGLKANAWFTFYHDAYYRAIRFDENGKIAESVKRIRP